MALISCPLRPCYCDDDGDNHACCDLPDIFSEQNRFPASLFGHRVAMSSIDFNIEHLLKNFNNLEIYCDAPEESIYESTRRCTVDVSLAEALHFPQKISTRLPTEISRCQQIALKDVKAIWCRNAAHYFEWVAGVPEFRLMDMQEKLKLVSRQLCRIICLMISYWTYRQGHDGMVLGCGICFIPTEVQDESLKSFLNSLVNVIQSNIVSTFRKIAMTREEYLLMKLIVFFDPAYLKLSPTDRLVVEAALKKYQAALVNHIKFSHPSLDHNSLTERISALLGTMPYLELAAQVNNFFMTVMTVHNNGNMQGQLTNEIHVDSMKIF
uniref:NR LBD domain-containing protein n=1 Tax=Haemonchus contortus TaxID=6289 RepID=A0A7I4YJU8_HAECO